MSAIYSKILKPWVIALLAVIPLTMGCGDSTRNDQGVSFTALGWYADESGTAAANLYTSIAYPIEGVEDADSPLNKGGAVVAYMGLQNNLMGQTIRVDRIHLDYYIPGADVQLDSTSMSTAVTLLANSTNTTDVHSDSSLPESLRSGTEQAYVPVMVLTPAIREFLYLNKESMPEPPFQMAVTATAEGVTSAGNRVYSNPIDLEVVILPELIIHPTVADGETAADTSDDEDY